GCSMNIEARPRRPRAPIAVKNYGRVDQPRLLRTEFLRFKAALLQKMWPLIREKYIRIPEQPLELRPILLRVAQDRRAHSHLRVPCKEIDLACMKSPNVEHVRAIKRQAPTHCSAGNDVAHAERANPAKGKIAAPSKWDWLAVAYFFNRDKRRCRQCICVLSLSAKFLVGANNRHGHPGLCRSLFQV